MTQFHFEEEDIKPLGDALDQLNKYSLKIADDTVKHAIRHQLRILAKFVSRLEAELGPR